MSVDRRLVAGVDSSTQSCKVVIVDPSTGGILRSGSAPHPAGTEVDPEAWWSALQKAVSEAGGFADVAAVSISGQQHGLIALDQTRTGHPRCSALERSAQRRGSTSTHR